MTDPTPKAVVVPTGTELLHAVIATLRGHVQALSDGKKLVRDGMPAPSPSPIYAVFKALPGIVRELEMAELEIESDFERYDDLAAPQASLPPVEGVRAADILDCATWLPLDENGAAEVRVNGQRITSMPSYAGAEEIAERINKALVITADHRAALSPVPSGGGDDYSHIVPDNSDAAERVEAWINECGVRDMVKNVSSVFSRWADIALLDRFETQVLAILSMSFLEGAARASPVPAVEAATYDDVILRADKNDKLQVYSSRFNVQMMTFPVGTPERQRREFFARLVAAPSAPGEPSPPSSDHEAMRAEWREGREEGRLAPRAWQPGDHVPAVGGMVLVSGANCDIESDQHRAFTWRRVVGYGEDNGFVCLQAKGCWPTVERMTNCWFAALGDGK